MNLAFINETVHFNTKLKQMPYFEYCRRFKLPVTLLYITQNMSFLIDTIIYGLLR